MKNLSTLRLPIILAIMFLFSPLLEAQDATYTIGIDGPHITNLWNTKIKNNAELTDGSTITINFPEGKSYSPYTCSDLKHVVTVIIQGAGADKTVVMKDTTTGLAQQPAGRLLFFNGAANNPAGSKVIVKDLTLKDFNFFGTADAGAALCLQGGVVDVDFSFINVNFEGLEASRGAIASVVGDGCDIEFDNCFFSNSRSFVKNSTSNGLIWVRENAGEEATNSVTITNCTFVSDTAKVIYRDVDPPADLGLRIGTVLDFASHKGLNELDALLEDNVFIDNKVESGASDEFIQPAVSFVADSGAIVSLEMNNNIFIGNRRAGKDNDVDILVENAKDQDNVEITADGNIANKMVIGTWSDTVETFENLMTEGFMVNPDYTYTDSRINFTMDGDLPALTADEYGIKHASYTGDGGVGINNTNIRSSLKVYPNPSNGLFEIELSGISSGAAGYKIYNITGSIVKEGIFSRDINQLDMQANPKGMYILKINGEKPGYAKLIVR